MSCARTHASAALAFRKHCDYACPLQRFDRNDRPVLWACLGAAVFLAVLLIVERLA
jgi:hypothetical protein